MTHRIFITGTDTDIGKTFVTSILMSSMRERNLSVAALKPVAAGAIEVEGAQVNADVAVLSKQCSAKYSYSQINPFLLADPIAPHIAAAQEGISLNVESCLSACQPMLEEPVDVLLVEGAGGWLVPLNESETLADLAVALRAGVIVVVGLRLGCINHALLTAQAVRQSGAQLLGWVANTLDPDMPCQNDNLQAIEARIDAPLLATIPYLSALSEADDMSLFDVDLLLTHC